MPHPIARRGIVFLLGFLPLAALCQQAPPPPPADGILDETRAIPPNMRAELAREIQNFTRNTGCKFYLVATTFLPNKVTIRDHTQALGDAWMHDEPGILMAYDRSAAAHNVAPSEQLWIRYPVPDLVDTFRLAGAILERTDSSVDARLAAAARLMMQRISGMEASLRQRNRLLGGNEKWFALGFVLLLGAAAYGASRYLSRLRVRETEDALEHLFPQVDVGVRLGAPHGGGVVAETRWDNAKAPPQQGA